MAANALFDRNLYVERVARVTGRNVLSDFIAPDLADRLSIVTRDFASTLMIAPDPEPMATVLGSWGRAGEITAMPPPVSDDLRLVPESYDCVLDVLDLHVVNDVPGRLAQVRRALRPDGMFLGCLFAGNTLGELRQSWLAAETNLVGGVTPRVAPMIELRELGALLQRADFALPVADLDRTVVRYKDALALMAEIRGLGLANSLLARSCNFVARRVLASVVNHYHEHFADADGRIRATVEVAWLTGWAPHESQPKPLKPGSAQVRLADALKVRERKL
jgi:SAM-dependent methyltransferase